MWCRKQSPGFCFLQLFWLSNFAVSLQNGDSGFLQVLCEPQIKGIPWSYLSCLTWGFGTPLEVCDAPFHRVGAQRWWRWAGRAQPGLAPGPQALPACQEHAMGYFRGLSSRDVSSFCGHNQSRSQVALVVSYDERLEFFWADWSASAGR